KHLPFSKLFNHFFSNFFNRRWDPDFYNWKCQARTNPGSGKNRGYSPSIPGQARFKDTPERL
ncbi:MULTISPECIES: hypothetical protein, partial [Butyricimonas]|uniref:hypothetical protein n=1 Tax=Butyricimonas TaxID=574697 RepID=UPI0025861F6D